MRDLNILLMSSLKNQRSRTSHENLRFDLGIENLFEEDYERVFEGVSEPGRNFKIAASYQFGG